MSDHTTTIVPLESWCYSSPEVRDKGKTVDIGLFAEALIYYDCVLANITNQPQLAEFLKWFIVQNRLDDFLSLVRDGIIKIYDYSFATTAVKNQETGYYSILNIQDPIQQKPNTFERRFLYHKSVEELFPKARHRQRLYEAFRGNAIEVKAVEFGNATENARKDYQDPHRNALILQAFVDELYHLRKLGHPPEIEVTVRRSKDGTKHQISWGVDFTELTRISGNKLNFHPGMPLTAGAISNRLLWSAAQLSCDLYLANPLGMIVGDKLYESTQSVAKAGTVIEELKAKVEFPDVRSLVNSGKLDFHHVLSIRKKSRKFREWLQQESERDRDAIIAYHNETAREMGLLTVGRKSLSILGVIGGGAVGSLVGTTIAGPIGAAVGGAAGSSIGYFADIVSKMGGDWSPIVFGNWYRKRIEKYLEKKTKD